MIALYRLSYEALMTNIELACRSSAA